VEQLHAVRARRDAEAVARALDALSDAARSGANTMPAILDAVRSYATTGEMCDALRDVWGEYVEVPTV
jgi:methylmalonyl-CoA mutase N-terminal domain/subunit